jgi:hypothetical protein
MVDVTTPPISDELKASKAEKADQVCSGVLGEITCVYCNVLSLSASASFQFVCLHLIKFFEHAFQSLYISQSL